MMIPLISVHVAKAGGTALGQALQKIYGSALSTEYHDDPANPTSQRNIDPISYLQRSQKLPEGIYAVHGHFHPGKYRSDNNTMFATILRHPVDNVMSIFWFWRNLQTGQNPIHDYCIKNNLRIEEMASLPLIRNLFSSTYFGGFDMKRFDVVGRHEDREAFGKKLSTIIGNDLDLSSRANVTPTSNERKEMEHNISLRQKLADILKEDIKFYEQHAR